MSWLVVLVLQDCVCAWYYPSLAGSANITGCPTVSSPHTPGPPPQKMNGWLRSGHWWSGRTRDGGALSGEDTHHWPHHWEDAGRRGEEEEGEAKARLLCPELWLAVSPLPPSCPAQTDSPVRAWPAGGRSLSLTTCNTDWTVASAGEGGRGGGSCRNKLENINTTSSHVVSQ